MAPPPAAVRGCRADSAAVGVGVGRPLPLLSRKFGLRTPAARTVLNGHPSGDIRAPAADSGVGNWPVRTAVKKCPELAEGEKLELWQIVRRGSNQRTVLRPGRPRPGREFSAESEQSRPSLHTFVFNRT